MNIANVRELKRGRSLPLNLKVLLLLVSHRAAEMETVIRQKKFHEGGVSIWQVVVIAAVTDRISSGLAM